MSISPNMNLIIPAVSVTIGPDWAEQLNASLTLIDQHDHTPGYGVQITPAAFNINTALSFNSFPATNLQASVYSAQSSLSTLRAVYVIGADLYFNDGNSNVVRITQTGSVAGTPGSISGLVSPASASYSAPTFVFQSNALTPANLDAGSIILRNIAASSFGLTLNPPAAMASNRSITFPNLPVANKIMALDNSGNITAAIDVDNITLQLAANTLSVKNLGIDTAQLANGSVTAAKIASGVLMTLQSQTFTANGTFTIPAGLVGNTIWAEIQAGGGSGGGGGGAGGAGYGAGGGGGSAGEYIYTVLDVTGLSTVPVVVATGVTGGAAGLANATGGTGNAGNVSSVAAVKTVTARGGLGGVGGASGLLAAGGAGGAALSAKPPFNMINAAGGTGGTSGNGPGNATAGITGTDSSAFSGGAGGTVSTNNGAGGGGGGASYFAAGGAGANGTNGTGITATAGTIGSGGGGGGGSGNSGGAIGGVGGAGPVGQVTIYFYSK